MITCKAINTGGLGRMGNNMFSIAGTIGIAMKNNQAFGFPPWIIADNAIFGNPVDSMAEHFITPLPPIDEGLNFQRLDYHWEYRDYSLPMGDWDIFAHLQDERYFKDYMPLIRHYFRMKDEPEQNDYVAIHYRAGDYIDDPAAYHPRCSREYYVAAMQQFPQGTKFYTFSDNKKELYNKLGIDSPYTEPTSYIEDFKMMKRCKSFITANSSFSFMAALLGEHPEKKIIMPRQWFGSQAGGMTINYPENAIVL